MALQCYHTALRLDYLFCDTSLHLGNHFCDTSLHLVNHFCDTSLHLVNHFYDTTFQYIINHFCDTACCVYTQYVRFIGWYYAVFFHTQNSTLKNAKQFNLLWNLFVKSAKQMVIAKLHSSVTPETLSWKLDDQSIISIGERKPMNIQIHKLQFKYVPIHKLYSKYVHTIVYYVYFSLTELFAL